MGAKPSRAAENAEETSQQFREGAKEMKEKAKEVYGRVTGRGEYGTEKYKKYQLPVKGPELLDSDYSFFTETTNKSRDDIKQIFEKYNLNKENAQIDRENFIKINQELNPELREQANEVADQSFHAFDPDNTGNLSLNEFLVSYALLSNRGDMRRKLDYSFDLYDYDHTGYLEKDDVKNVLCGFCDLLGAEKKNKNVQECVDRTVRDIQFDDQGRVTKGKSLILNKHNSKKL
jgi:Ca2+-binding EF-hand superfamily protein